MFCLVDDNTLTFYKTCPFISEDFKDYLTLGISAASLLVSVATVVVGWLIYKKFLLQKLTENQLQVVLDLIKSTYDNVFHITFVHNHGADGMGYGYEHKNLFQLANSGSIAVDSEYNFPVILHTDYSFVFEPWTFLSNPLLPDAIGKQLHAFHDSIVLKPTDPDKIKRYIIIGERKHKELQEAPGFALSQIDGGLSTLVDHCKLIDREIKKWLKVHGLRDLNQHVVSTEYRRWL